MINLRNYLLCFAIIISLLSLCCCILEDSHGFPKKITFSANGESKVIHGDGSSRLYSINIFEGKNCVENIGSYTLWDSDLDSLNSDSVVFGWISLKAISPGYEIELTASPNESHKKRFLSFELWFGRERLFITVTQNGR